MRPKRSAYVLCLCILFLVTEICSADVSVNVPLGNWSYDALDKLVSLGLVQSAIFSAKPFTRLEMARLTIEARSALEKQKDHLGASATRIAHELVQRLRKEFNAEIQEIEGTTKVSFYLKPFEDLYATYYHSTEDFAFEYDKGREFCDGSSFKAGFSAHAALFRHLAFYFNPEFRYSKGEFPSEDYKVSLLEGYGKLELWNIELEVGRDSLWWGPGRHGALILTDNVRPFDLIKISNPRPVVLPWIFKYLGLFKFQGFYTKLEGNRYIPKPELMGFRVDIKPFPFLELGASRTIILGGEGDNAPKGVSELSFTDWLKLLSGQNISGSLDTDQIAGVDATLHINNLDNFVRVLKTLDIWGQLYGEDEAASLPSRNGFVLGMRLGDIFLTGRTNLVIEHADNVINGYPNFWYNHHVYKSGYTYYKRIMGHEMGSEARDTYVSLEHYLRPDLIAWLSYDY
ncbi:MAG: hypothetical protein DRH12_13375, partial [Deltaproteobacteria bacterium]